MSIRPALLHAARRARPFVTAALLVISTLPNFVPQAAHATDNCTAALYGTSDSVTGSSASSSTTAVEVGVKFTPAFATTATAVRFYRSVADSGGYSVHLWDSDGTLLGSGTDTSATGTGWISVNLGSPVSLTAGTTYISSYLAAHGRQQSKADVYSADDDSNTMVSTPAEAGVYKANSGATSAINPSADTYVSSVNATTNYGSANPLKATDVQNRALLRFDTNAVVPSGTVVTGATLKIYVTSIAVTSGGFEVHPEDNSWTDSSVTWNTQPTWSSSVLGTSSTPTTNSWITVSLPASAVNYRGDTSLGLRYTVNSSSAQFASVEDSAYKPQLTVNYSSATTGTTAMNPSADTYVNSVNAITNYATANPLSATQAQNRAFLRFDTNGVIPSGTVMTSATLKIYVTDNAVSSGGFTVHPEADTWTESGTSWSNQPAWDDVPAATSATPTAGSWVTVKLPSSVLTTNGNTSLGLVYTAGTSGTKFASREDSSHMPELDISYAPGTTGSESAGSSSSNPTGDTYVSSANASTNYATATPLSATDVQNRAFLRFDTSSTVPSGHTVTGATLKIYVTNLSVTSGGFEVHPETDSWTESGATWNNQPTWDSTVLNTSSSPANGGWGAGSWITIGLPASAVSTSGNTSLGLRYTVNSSGAKLASREDSTHKPQLTVNYSRDADSYTPDFPPATFTAAADGYYVSPVLTYNDTTAPAVPTNVTPSVGPNSVTLNWDQALDTQSSSAVTRAQSYTIYRGGTQIGTAGPDITTYNDDGLAKGTYTYTVKAKDYCGNTSGFSSGAPAELSDDLLFTGTSAPSATTANDPNPTTVGVQFTSSTPGEVRGVEFYRSEAVGDGASIGVWDSNGNLLGSGDVADSDSTGWVTALLQDPVKVTASTTYTVGYYTPAGNYPVTSQGLYTPITNGNLTAQASGGVLHSGTGMVLGTSTTNDNYYVSPVVGQKQLAGVSEGDIVYAQTDTHHIDDDNPAPWPITVHTSDGTSTRLDPSNQINFASDVSPDGSRIAYDSFGPSCWMHVLTVMNSDGSGTSPLTGQQCSTFEDASWPAWSPDGQQIIFSRSTTSSYNKVTKINADGSGKTTLSNQSWCGGLSWSPDGSQIVYSCEVTSGVSQLYIMNADGSNQHLLAGSSTGYSDYQPVWSPDGSRIYFQSTQVVNGAAGHIWYYSSTDGFATTTNVSLHYLSSAQPESPMKISHDGNTLAYSEGYYANIHTVDTSTGDSTQLGFHGLYPTFVPRSYGFVDGVSTAMTPSGDAVSVDAPKAADKFLTRGIHIKLSDSGVDYWEYKWCPATGSCGAVGAVLDPSGDPATVDNGVVDYSVTQPDANWYLWVKPHNSTTWNGGGDPLLVHTPKRPVWVAVGDSYSSGHNQPNDDWFCPDLGTHERWWNQLGAALVAGLNACYVSGANVNYEDPDFSWVSGAIDGFNMGKPSQWQIVDKDIVAISGSKTSDFGVPGKTPGTNAWASGNTQASKLRAAMSTGADSWNVVSMTGGGIDADLVPVLTKFYKLHIPPLPTSIGDFAKPWIGGARVNCPDTDHINSTLDKNDWSIQTNLYGIVTIAHRASPGVRILNVGYPYIHNQVDTCYGHSSFWLPHAGSGEVVDRVNNDHKAVVGTNVRYVDLTGSDTFGSCPIPGVDTSSCPGSTSNSLIQLTRLYGYPHPSASGQTKMATKAKAVLSGTGWQN